MKKVFTTAEIEYEISQSKILIIFNYKVYDLTKWAQFHPGGILAISHMNGDILLTLGKDATDVILAYHPDWVIQKKMTHFCVGEISIESRTLSKISASYRALDLEIRKKGLYATNYTFFIREFIKFAIMWGCGIWLLLYFKNLPGVTASALIFAALWWQAAFVAHDAGHSGITHDQWTDTVMGICLGNFLGGVSLGWWKKNHNVHHIVTNHPEHDPDIQHLPFIAVTSRFMKNLYSTYYNRVLEFDMVARIFVPIQHYLFYVILCFGRFNLYANSIAYVASNERVPHRALEISGLVFFVIWYSTLLSTLSFGLAITHILVSHMFTVLLHIQITLSHFGMDTSIVENEEYATMALRTSMDVECPRWLDWFHGGLQFQVEHHLFPRVPRHNLRLLQPLVQEFAKQNGLQFHSYKFLKGNWIVLKCLQKVANQVSESIKWSDKTVE